MPTSTLDPPASATTGARRPSSVQIIGALTGHALQAFLRTPIAAFFTLVFPLLMMVIVAAVVGDQVVDPVRGTRVTQYLVSPFAVFGVAEAAFCVLAIDMALLRENGVLNRLRGTPTPQWMVLASRIASAVIVALLCVGILLVVGVTVYGVQLSWAKTPAMLLTLVTGIACFACLGLALVALTRSALAAQTLSNGLLIPLAFISNVFIVGAALPAALERLGEALPLRHFADALALSFDPAYTGSAFSGPDLAVMAAWGVAGAAVATWRFGWEPRRGGRTEATGAEPGENGAPAVTGAALAVRRPGRPSALALLRGQSGYALTTLARDPLSVFFSLVFPVLLLLLFPVVFKGAQPLGMSIVDFMVPGMITYATAVTAYLSMPETVAQARDRGVLKRLTGTPLPRWAYLGGRLVATLLVATAAAVILVVVAALAYDYGVPLGQLPALIVAFLLGLACFTALGFALVAVVPSAQAMPAVALGTLLPLSFISDVFMIGTGELPPALRFVGDLFPLKHMARALQSALDPVAGGFAWGNLAVIVAWTVAGLAIASRMSWEPHSR